MENLVLKEVDELIGTFKENVDKCLLIQDIFLVPVLNGLWKLTAGMRFPKKNLTPIKLIRDYVS